jgi:hypothetical protein
MFFRSIRYLIFTLIAGLVLSAGVPGRTEIYLQEFDCTSSEFLGLEAINQVRYEHGLPLLLLDNDLSKVSRRHALDMARRDYFDHYSPEGASPDDRVREAGLSYEVCENIGIIRSFGHNSRAVVKALMDSFLASPDHLANILNPDVTHVGIGFCQDINGNNHRLESGRDANSNYSGFGTVLVVQDFCKRRVRIIEPSPFFGTAREGEYLNFEVAFADSVQEAFLRVTPDEKPLEAFEIPLSQCSENYRARFSIDMQGKFTIAIYANSPEENWFYREQGRLQVVVQPPFL